VVDSIVVTSTAPTVAGVNKVPVLRKLATRFHVTTREEVIRRFLLLRTGDECTELRRAESERILRAQNFLAEAHVDARPSALGGVVLDVKTTDETSIVLGGSAVTRLPIARSIKFGNSNIGGTTTYATGAWHEGDGYRDGFGLRLQHQQLFGRPYAANVELEQQPLGQRWLTELGHPFYTDLQRIAWRVRSGSSVDYITFPTDSSFDRALRLERKFTDVGGIVRLGPPGRLTLVGASLTGDEDVPANTPVIISDTGLAPDVDPTLYFRYQAHRIARANVLWGVRDIRFVSVNGYDALTGTQDIPVGFQLGTMFGRSLSVLGSRDDDIFLASDLYIGWMTEYTAFRLQTQAEGRRNNELSAWDGILTTGRAAEYVKASPRFLLLGSLEWSGGWKERIPYNLSLADPVAGVRGFFNSHIVGAERVVTRLEARWLGPPLSIGDIGLAAFSDVGQLYPGDVPFGTRSPLSGSVGLSLLAAAPKHSARLWRMDVALAVKGNPEGRRIEVRFVGNDNTKFFFREPDDVARTRELTVPSSVFRWP
jgi:hypothetical protein